MNDPHKQTAMIAARMLLDSGAVMFNAREPFRYTSGNVGPVYVDCRRPLSFPLERGTLMALAVQTITDEVGADSIDAIAGAETAGIPYGAMIADRMQKPFVYVRKQPKGHGRMSQIEGYLAEGAAPRVLLTEDLQNFGSSKKVFIEALRAAGAEVAHFFVLFDYGIRTEVAADNAAMGVTQHALCDWWDVLAAARDGKYFDTETLDSVERYLKDPSGWAAPTQQERA